MIKSRRIRWAVHVADMGTGKVHGGFWWREPREGDYLEDPSLNERITLKWIFKKWGGEAWTGLLWLRIGTVCWRL
jgi:hypothetical protein